MSRPQTRRRWFIPGSEQLRILRPLLFGGVGVVVVVFALFYSVAQRDLGHEMVQAHSTLRTTMQLLAPSLMVILLLGYVLLALLLTWWSRHLAGPLLRLRNSLDTLAEGQDLEPIRLRKGDAGVSLAESVNRIAGRLAGERRERAELGAEASRLQAAAESGDLSAAEALDTLSHRLSGSSV